jgi:NitT/TauT family transport system substrate-binding protein
VRARQDGSAASVTAACRHCYDVWREYDPDDTLRFYALRLYEAGFIRSSPNKLIAEHTDWRVLGELKRELKV